LALLVLLATAVAADAGGIFTRKGKSDFRVRQLVDTLRNETDSARRRSAITELKEADPRTQLDVIPALVAALRHDATAGVRADAAEAIGQFKQVYPVAGLALETAAESDLSPAVRDAAQQALWEYHLSGYRSARWADGITGQTAEPPLARPAIRTAAAIEAAPAAPLQARSAGLAKLAIPPRPVRLPHIELPPPPVLTGFRPAPELLLPESPIEPRVFLTAAPPPQLNVTAEPPRAARPKFASAPMPRLVEPLPVPTPEITPVPSLLWVPRPIGLRRFGLPRDN
jgi:hypothetical protein